MSRAIAESLSLLSETLDNCKTNLTEKQVADVDNIKISDVDEKIAVIKTGIDPETITSRLQQSVKSGNDYSQNLNELDITLNNCKSALAKKGIQNVDNIKISDIDEKIAEIQAGGGVSGIDDPIIGKYLTIKNVLVNNQSIEDFSTVTNSPNTFNVEIKFQEETNIPTLVKNTLNFILYSTYGDMEASSSGRFTNLHLGSSSSSKANVILLANYEIKKNNDSFIVVERICSFKVKKSS